MKIEDLHKQGWTIKEIAAETGFHPSTVSRRLRQGLPPRGRAAPDGAKVMTRRWSERVEALVAEHPRLLGVSVWRFLRAEGFCGGYATVTRELRRIRGPRFRAADRVSVPIFTEPGEEAQFDWCDLDAAARRWGWGGRLRCFGMILCWSRRRVWQFSGSEDRNHTFEGMVRFFEAVGFGEKLTEQITMKCTTDERDWMDAIADTCGWSVGRIMRALVRAEAVRLGLTEAVQPCACHARSPIVHAGNNSPRQRDYIEHACGKHGGDGRPCRHCPRRPVPKDSSDPA